MAKVKSKIEYGDFQTPRELADSIVVFLRDAGISPSVIVEPTCGLGNFVLAATEGFPTVRQMFAYDIKADYVSALRKVLRDANGVHCHVAQQDFFSLNWNEFFSAFREEILVLGNLPWVTNAALGAIGSNNLPQKTNFQNRSGFAAKTGKANFDISEWMLIKLLESLDGQHGCVAMLCKTATARKVLRHGWVNRFNIGRATIHLIDAAAYFGVSVNACLLIVHTGVPDLSPTAGVYSDLTFNHKVTTFGLMGRELVADVDEYNRLRDLDGLAYYTWRSGVKHDAVSVMEFKKEGSTFINGVGERVELEPTYIYPLLKSSDLANGRLTPQRYVLVTQHTPGDDTKAISRTAPKTWSYLLRHADVLDRRQSIIYQKRPRFSVFGVGDYTFSPWKVAISGFYKNCRFEVVGKYQNKPVILDDTCYFIPCSSEQEASFACLLLSSDLAKRFLHALVFYDAKRPVTIDVLNRIDLKRISERLGLESDARKYFRDAAFFEGRQGLFVFEKQEKYRTLSEKEDERMPLAAEQIEQLREAIDSYSFPAVFFDFRNNREVQTTCIRNVETVIGGQLRSEDTETVKHGLGNILYWGYAQVGFRDNRVEVFVNNVSDSQLREFQALLVNDRTPKMMEIKAIRMPQYSGMSFISKVLMFLDPVAYCVLDRQIAKLRTPNSPKALNSLAFGQKEALIRISRQNENVYDRWRAECLAVSQAYFGNQYRVVDIERGFFNLIQQGCLLSAQAIYNDA